METFKYQVKQKSNDELVNIFIKSRDYQAEFIKVVEEELLKRNIPIESISQIKDQADDISDAKLKMGEQGNTLYIAICFLAALLGGIISIVAGFIYAYSKRKTLQGEDVYYYNEQTRKYGKWMLAIGSFFFMLSLWLKIN